MDMVGGCWWLITLWKIWVRQLGWWHSHYGKIKNVPNHQPANIGDTISNKYLKEMWNKSPKWDIYKSLRNLGNTWLYLRMEHDGTMIENLAMQPGIVWKCVNCTSKEFMLWVALGQTPQRRALSSSTPLYRWPRQVALAALESNSWTVGSTLVISATQRIPKDSRRVAIFVASVCSSHLCCDGRHQKLQGQLQKQMQIMPSKCSRDQVQCFTVRCHLKLI